eukprot:g1638.t1
MSRAQQKDTSAVDQMIDTIFAEEHAEQQDTTTSDATDFTVVKCQSNCITVGQNCGPNEWNRSTIPECFIAVTPMATGPTYPGPVIPAACGIPTPIMRLKQLDCYLPRTVQVFADSWGFFPANTVAFDEDLTRKIACAMAPYARIPNAKLNQYICDYQNQWIFFLGSLLLLTPCPLRDRMFSAANNVMKASLNPRGAFRQMFGWGCGGTINQCGGVECNPPCPPGFTCKCSNCNQPELRDPCADIDCDADAGLSVPDMCSGGKTGTWSLFGN